MEKKIYCYSLFIIDYNYTKYTQTYKGFLKMTDWDKRYKEGFYDGAREPHTLLQKYWSIIPRGYVIDIAMGNGRDALFLAQKGFVVCGLERSEEAIKATLRSLKETQQSVGIVRADAIALPFKKNMASGIVVFYFLMRSIMKELVATLRKDGVIIYETFLKRQNMIDRWRNPEYLLDDGELIEHFQGLEPLYYEEKIYYYNSRTRAVAQYVGRKI